MQGITDFRKIQTFYTKYRPNKDPFEQKVCITDPGPKIRTLVAALGGGISIHVGLNLVRAFFSLCLEGFRLFFDGRNSVVKASMSLKTEMKM